MALVSDDPLILKDETVVFAIRHKGKTYGLGLELHSYPPGMMEKGLGFLNLGLRKKLEELELLPRAPVPWQ